MEAAARADAALEDDLHTMIEEEGGGGGAATNEEEGDNFVDDALFNILYEKGHDEAWDDAGGDEAVVDDNKNGTNNTFEDSSCDDDDAIINEGGQDYGFTQVIRTLPASSYSATDSTQMYRGGSTKFADTTMFTPPPEPRTPQQTAPSIEMLNFQRAVPSLMAPALDALRSDEVNCCY